MVTIDHVMQRGFRARPTADEIADRATSEIGRRIKEISALYQRETAAISN